jgi:hypothetical protein
VTTTRERRGVLLAIILAGYAMAVLDVSIVMAALARIQHVLGFSATGLSWVHNAYALTFGGLLLVGARAGDLLGRRRMFVAGIALFTAASLATGLAQSPAWMISARALQGVGAAILAPATLALLSTSFPEGHDRTHAMAAYGAVAGVATAAGLVLGGLFTDTLSWRVGFLINVPIGIAAILAAPRYVAEAPGPLRRHRRRHLDAGGEPAGLRHRALRERRLGRHHHGDLAAGGRRAARALRRQPVAGRAADHAPATVLQPRARRRLRGPLPLHRRPREPDLLHDPVPPRRQRLQPAPGRPRLPSADARRPRDRDRHPTADATLRERAPAHRRDRRHPDRHRLAEPRLRRHAVPHRHRTADGRLRHRASPRPQRPHDRRHGRSHPRRRRRRGRGGQRRPPPRRCRRPRHPRHRLRRRRLRGGRCRRAPRRPRLGRPHRRDRTPRARPRRRADHPPSPGRPSGGGDHGRPTRFTGAPCRSPRPPSTPRPGRATGSPARSSSTPSRLRQLRQSGHRARPRRAVLRRAGSGDGDGVTRSPGRRHARGSSTARGRRRSAAGARRPFARPARSHRPPR